MSLNPLNELKRRLEDDLSPLPKRICLAKNVVLSHHFPSAPKEAIVASWLYGLSQTNLLDGKHLREILNWVAVEDVTSELKGMLIKILTQFLQNNRIQEESVNYVLLFLENNKISQQITQQVDDYLIIVVTLLQYLKKQETLNSSLCQRIFSNVTKYYKECKKKLDFIIKLLDGKNLESIFSYLETDCHEAVVCLCQNVLFPMNKKSFYVSFLQTLIRKDNIDELMAEKGDNIQSVLKIMSAFFTFPSGRTEKNPNFLSNFIEVFVSCFRSESQLIFAFYIMVVNSLNMDQSYLNPAMKMPAIIFELNDSKIKRNMFFKLLEVLLKNEVDISVRLTDTFGEKISKVEIKKNFMSFLQAVMMGQLKLEGKVDKATLNIINIALKLDPEIIEQKMDLILPPIMASKKTHSTNESYVDIQIRYVDMLSYLLEILFKLSRGPTFFNQILPHIKLSLEASNTEQFELKQRIKELEESGMDSANLKNKLITGNDVFPQECAVMYGKWASELMFRQNKELLVNLQKDFEEHCLMMLQEGFVSPSIITLAEILSAILSSFLQHCKMADHTVPKQISEDFWNYFGKFESECLGKFGECVLKLSYDPKLALAFLNLSLSVAKLKLLNVKYSNTKLDVAVACPSGVFDMSTILPCLDAQQWTQLAGKVTDDEAVLVLNSLLLAKIIATRLKHSEVGETEALEIFAIKTHLIKQIGSYPDMLNDSGFFNPLFADLDKSQLKLLAKNLFGIYMNNPDTVILKLEAIVGNRSVLNALVLETAKNMAKCFNNLEHLSKSLKKYLDLSSFVKEIDIVSYFEQISLKDDQETNISNCLGIYRQLPLPYLEETYQLLTIFLLLSTKKCCQKKIRKSVDHILLNIFEVSPKYPDLYKIIPVDIIFSFEDKTVLNLLTLRIKTANNMFVIKSILESAVKKVKTNSEIVKRAVELLLSQLKSKKEDITIIEYFSDPVFQITCIILPIITKEKRAITTSAYRSILASLQEKLHKSLLKCFNNIDFGRNSSLLNESNGDSDESVVVSENTLAILNAMAAFSLTLGKCCETNDADEMKNLEYLSYGGLFFIRNAITSIGNPATKTHHIESSIQLLNVALRHIKKLETYTIFQDKEKILIEIWRAAVERLKIVFGENKRVAMDDIAVTLKFVCELSALDGSLWSTILQDFTSLGVLAIDKTPSDLQKDISTITSHKVSKYVWTQILRATLPGPKCAALSKLLGKNCKELRSWIQVHCEDIDTKKRKAEDEVKAIQVCDEVCDVLKIDLDVIAVAVLSAKKITLDYKLLDSIFSLQHQVHCIMSGEVSWDSFFKLFEGCVAVQNSLIMSREELLEDRWPNYMQCYRALIACLCSRSPSNRPQEEKLAHISHSLEKLTQSICKRKAHVSRIAAYSVADICSLLERTGPTKMVRQHLENSAAIMLQAADSSYAAAFLRRALASSPGHVTLGNMYTLYKRYHKYVGNA